MSNVSRITKAVLATELAAARARIHQLEGQLIAERANHARAATNTVIATARIQPAMPQWQIDRAAAMAAAQNMAMKTRSVVKV